MPHFEGTMDEALGDTLALVNVARQAFGHEMITELPDARPGKAADCLFYRALSPLGATRVDGYGNISFNDERAAAYCASLWGTQADGAFVKAPDQFKQVISAFDNGSAGQLAHYTTTRARNFE